MHHPDPAAGEIEDRLRGLRAGPYPKPTEILAGDRHVFEFMPGQSVQLRRAAGQDLDDFLRSALIETTKLAPLWQELTDVVHPLRLRCRTLVAEAQARGLPISYIRTDAHAIDGWPSMDRPRLLFGVVSLQSNLRPGPRWLSATDVDELDHLFADEIRDLEVRSRRRSELGLLGADGSVDALALGVIRRNGDPKDAIMALRDRQHVRLDDGCLLLWNDGHVCCGDGTASGIVTWLDDHVIIAGVVLPATAGSASVGRPITDLIEHPALSSDMLVDDVTVVAEPELQTIVRLRLDTWLIDTTIGSYWRA